jgi:hypothetical protein
VVRVSSNAGIAEHFALGEVLQGIIPRGVCTLIFPAKTLDKESSTIRASPSSVRRSRPNRGP